MSSPKLKVLLAEDDPNLGQLLVEYLDSEGFEAVLCPDGQLGLTSFNSQHFDLCLLDVMMPKMDGFALATEIRSRNKQIPILFLTAKSLKEDKLKGYELGADDYILKPFDEEELLWKMRALLRRNTSTDSEVASRILKIGKYEFDPQNLNLVHSGSSNRLTEKEGKILTYLAQNQNQLVKREDLLKNLWGENDYFLGRSLDVFITKLRKYLKDDPNIRIENVFGVGFVLITA